MQTTEDPERYRAGWDRAFAQLDADLEVQRAAQLRLEAAAERGARAAIESRGRADDFELTADDAAAVIGVSADFARAHAAELGAARIGNQENGPLRFSRRGLAAYTDARRLAAAPTARPRRRPGPHRGDFELLPLPAHPSAAAAGQCA